MILYLSPIIVSFPLFYKCKSHLLVNKMILFYYNKYIAYNLSLANVLYVNCLMSPKKYNHVL